MGCGGGTLCLGAILSQRLEGMESVSCVLRCRCFRVRSYQFKAAHVNSGGGRSILTFNLSQAILHLTERVNKPTHTPTHGASCVCMRSCVRVCARAFGPSRPCLRSSVRVCGRLLLACVRERACFRACVRACALACVRSFCVRSRRRQGLARCTDRRGPQPPRGPRQTPLALEPVEQSK